MYSRYSRCSVDTHVFGVLDLLLVPLIRQSATDVGCLHVYCNQANQTCQWCHVVACLRSSCIYTRAVRSVIPTDTDNHRPSLVSCCSLHCLQYLACPRPIITINFNFSSTARHSCINSHFLTALFNWSPVHYSRRKRIPPVWWVCVLSQTDLIISVKTVARVMLQTSQTLRLWMWPFTSSLRFEPC